MYRVAELAESNCERCTGLWGELIDRNETAGLRRSRPGETYLDITELTSRFSLLDLP